MAVQVNSSSTVPLVIAIFWEWQPFSFLPVTIIFRSFILGFFFVLNVDVSQFCYLLNRGTRVVWTLWPGTQEAHFWYLDLMTQGYDAYILAILFYFIFLDKYFFFCCYMEYPPPTLTPLPLCSGHWCSCIFYLMVLFDIFSAYKLHACDDHMP